MPPARKPRAEQSSSEIAGGLAGTIINGVKKATDLSSQGMNNLLMLAMIVMLGFMISVYRSDKESSQVSQLRYYESRDEINRQTITAQTQAIQSLSVEIGKLQQTVFTLQLTVSTLQRAVERGKMPSD